MKTCLTAFLLKPLYLATPCFHGSLGRYSAHLHTPQGLREMSPSSEYASLQPTQKPKEDKWWVGKRGWADSQRTLEQGGVEMSPASWFCFSLSLGRGPVQRLSLRQWTKLQKVDFQSLLLESPKSLPCSLPLCLTNSQQPYSQPSV